MAKGMDPGVINAMRKAAKASEFEVWEENWEIVEMFLRMQTQWRVGMAGPTDWTMHRLNGFVNCIQ